MSSPNQSSFMFLFWTFSVQRLIVLQRLFIAFQALRCARVCLEDAME